MVDGVETKRTLLKNEVTIPPVNEVIAVGTKKPYMSFPEGYYTTLAALIPALWIALIYNAKIGERSIPQFSDEFEKLLVPLIRLIGLIGLPIMELGVLLSLYDQQQHGWVEAQILLVIVISMIQIVGPPAWGVVETSWIPERHRRVARRVAQGVVVVMLVAYLPAIMSHLTPNMPASG